MKIIPIASNMTELQLAHGTKVLFSYSTPVACFVYENGHSCLYKTTKKWSQTTTRHINKWVGGSYCEERSQEYFYNLVQGA